MVVGDHPVVAFIEGDGTGPEIWRASRMVLDKAVNAAYGKSRSIVWRELLAGEKAFRETGQWLPSETVEAIRELGMAIKGPLTTPVGGGIRSVNVALRQSLDLYACIRPVKHIPGVPSPLRHPERVDMVVFRENTEDVYAGIEYASGSQEAEKIREFLRLYLGRETPRGAAIGIKPISPDGSKRLIRMAIRYAIAHGLPSVTLMHKGNIMKFTEGGFRQWGYDLAREEFPDQTILERDVQSGGDPRGKVIIKDRMADSMFQQIILRPEEYHVIATTNLNGDYISDALAALVGGLGMAPGANVGEGAAVFEATHGTAPRYAGLDKMNPSSLILSGAMMLRHMGWCEAAERVEEALRQTIAAGTVTYDLARQMPQAVELSCSAFAEAVVSRIDQDKGA
jgi:isocitrate dehydrogenase